jgi:serine/threonine-protein kinase
MSEKPGNENTIDLSPDPNRVVRERFEAAWQRALQGGAQPSLATFLDQVSCPDRDTIVSELTSLDREYRNRLAQQHSLQAAGILLGEGCIAVGQTIDLAGKRPPDPNATVDPAMASAAPTPGGGRACAADTAQAVGDQTMGFDEAGSDATVDPSMGVASDPGTGKATMSPRHRPKAPGGPTVIGYDILGELGRGGMGVVYKARQQKLNRLVALKMVLSGAHAGPEQLARFYTEAEAVAHLQHPNIVQIYEVGEHDGLPYFSLEYVDGGSLDKKIAGTPQPIRAAAQMVETLAVAMSCAHLHGIIHRDLKPANVLLTKDGTPKITDFGLAKKLEGDSSQTKSGTLMGTPSYMAPEQARGDTREIGALADVYALGVILYESLTGRTPFVGTSVLDTLQQVRTQEPVPPSRLRPTVPRDLETVCLKCLQKEPQKRYPSAEALAQDLHRFLAGEPIKARPVGNAERLWRWCQRNPRVAMLTGAVAALLVAMTIGSTYAAIKISFEHDEAVKARVLADQKAEDEKAAHLLADQKAEEARKAEALAAENAKVANEQRGLALDTLFSVVTKTEEKLRDKADMLDLRKDLVETTMAGMGKLSRSAEIASKADRTMGIAHTRMGDVCERLSRTEEAIQQYKISLDIFERLVVQEPDNDQHAYNASVSCDKLGEMCREMEGDSTIARTYYERSLKLRERLAAEVRSPEPPAAGRAFGLAISYNRLSTFTLALGDPPGAYAYAKKTLGQGEKMRTEKPESLAAKQIIGHAEWNLGKAASHMATPDLARKHFEACIAVRQQLVDKRSDSAQVKLDLALAQEALGELELEEGHVAPALANFTKAHAVYTAIFEKDKTDAMLKLILGASFYRLGTARLQMGQTADAESDYRESRKFREELQKADPKNFQRKLELMPSVARCGDHVVASGLAEEFRQRKLESPDIVYTLGTTYALCIPAVAHGKKPGQLTSEEQATQKRYASLALESLKKAIAHGYKDTVALERDPDLAPLRACEGFDQLQKQVQSRAGDGASPSSESR